MYESEAAILPAFQAIVARSLRIDAARVTPEARLDELGAESIDMVEITMDCEAAFHVWLPEKTILETAEELLGAGTIVKNGYLTETGKQLLAERFRSEECVLPEGEVPLEAVRGRFMKVGSWVRMLANLVEHTPVNCPVCHGLLRPAAGFRLQCRGCGKEVHLQSGDELNREWLHQYFVKPASQSTSPPVTAPLRESA
ncbi:MAG: phosphopantetheine-binding protein [Acidobacteriota bacterium]